MPVVLHHNAKLEMNRAAYSGSVTMAELRAFAEHQAQNPPMLTYDCLNYVAPGADFATIPLPELDALFDYYKGLFAQVEFLIMRRSAWICESPAAQAHISYWMRGRNPRDGMSSDVRQFDTLEEAGEWLILNGAGIDALRSGEGFEEAVRCDIPAAPAAARQR